MEYDPIDYSFAFNAVGLVFYSFCSVLLLPNVRYHLVKESASMNYKRLLFSVFGFVIMLTLMFSLLCSYYFGSEVDANIFYNFDQKSGFLFYIQIFYIIMATGSDMIICFPLAEIVYQMPLIRTYIKKIELNSCKTYSFKLLIRITLVGTAALVSLLNAGLIDFMSFCTSITIGYIGAVMPTAYYIYFKHGTLKLHQKLFYWFMLILGILVWIVCSYVSFIDLLKQSNKSELIEAATKTSLTK